MRYITVALIVFVLGPGLAAAEEWTKDELAVLRSLWIGSLPPLPPDPTNKVADDPRAADFGHRLFFDTRLSANGKVGCVTCHDPARAFTDGRKRSKGVGETIRNSPTVVGAAYSPWLFFDGRKDSLWAQALAPFEDAKEHGFTRGRVVEVVRGDADYRRRYTELFGPLPAPVGKGGDKEGETRAFANLGKSIAAYERKLLPGPSKFDRYVEAMLEGREPAPKDRLTLDENQGLRVFMTDSLGQCMRCHNGPMFSNTDFHNIGLDGAGTMEDRAGRQTGIRKALADEFNCLGEYSDAHGEAKGDAKGEACTELRFAKTGGHTLAGAFKAPTLRYLPKTGPYMHTGSLESLDDVLWHYRDRPGGSVGKTELRSFTITGEEFDQLIAFLGALDGPINAPAKYLKAPARD